MILIRNRLTSEPKNGNALSFINPEASRLARCLAKLIPHFDCDRVALTGGVAIALALSDGIESRYQGRIEDLDFVAASWIAISDEVSRYFLVSHYHLPTRNCPKFMVQLVDPDSRMRVDVFPDLAGSLHRARRIILGRERLLVLDAESMLDHKLQTLSQASHSNPMDPKHYRDAVALGKFCGRVIPSMDPACLAKQVYSSDLSARCPRCEASRDSAFPLAEKQQIYELLGYV